MFIEKYDFAKDLYKVKSEKKYLIDLKNIIKKQLMSEGVLEKNIEVSDICTMCTDDMFFSHRLLGTKRGSQMAFLEM